RPGALIKIASGGELAVGAHTDHHAHVIAGSRIQDEIELPGIVQAVDAQAVIADIVRRGTFAAGPLDAAFVFGHPDPYPVAAGPVQVCTPAVVVIGAALARPAHVLADREIGPAIIESESRRIVFTPPHKAAVIRGSDPET